MKVLKVKKSLGGVVKKFLQKKGWLDAQHVIGKTQRYLLFPLKSADEKLLLRRFNGKIEERALPKVEKRRGGLKALLRGVIPEKYIDEVVRAYDVVGDIAIIDVPKKLDRLAKSIAWTLKRAFPNIKVVARKIGKVRDTYRIRKLEILVGEKRTETLHKEHGIKIDLTKAYFTPRSSGERARIAAQVKSGERVLIMFAGVGPYALIIAKKQPKCKIWAIELNPDAYKLMEENIRINRLGHIIKPICGDVREVVPKLKEKFNRIIMVLPERGFEFLDLAFKVASKKAVVHFYIFLHEDEIKKGIAKIQELAKKFGRKIKIIGAKKVGSFAPRVWRWCIEFEIF